DKYNDQYDNLKVIFNNTFHDRYFILDDKMVYHCGASINRIGYKTFSINLISDEIAIKALKDDVLTIK
ncbi:MAG: ORF6N domain-containing protein, partial [Oscillospiraceae bacterium]|nr:ORF6N domain-containing protein [Oscillospiraceae bacterium]